MILHLKLMHQLIPIPSSILHTLHLHKQTIILLHPLVKPLEVTDVHLSYHLLQLLVFRFVFLNGELDGALGILVDLV